MSSISTLGQAIDQIARLKVQQNNLDDLSSQIATGKKTQNFSGLGSDLLRSKRARADIKSLTQYTDNIVNGHRRIELMNNAMAQINDQVGTVLDAITVGIQQGEGPDLENLQKLASDVYNFVLDLMNEQDGDRYLFAGSDSSIPPIQDSGLFQTVLGNFVPDQDDITNPPLEASGFIGEWGNGTLTNQEFIDAYRSTNENVLGYSTSIVSGTTGDVRIRVDENSDFEYTVLANNEGMKNIVVALGVLKELPPVEFAPGALNDPTVTRPSDDIPPYPSSEKQDNFYEVLNDLASMMQQGVEDLRQEQHALALVQTQTNLVKDQHEYQINSYKTIIAQVEDVDLTEAVTKIQQLQVSLEASFSVTSLVSDLTLVNFLR